jgi:murein DD-endopeptidase MepM/ murein hydrolase activator NlpD
MIVTAGLSIVGLALLAFFIVDYQDTTAQLAEMRRGGQVAIVRQQNLREVIASELQREDNLRAIINGQVALVAEKDNINLEEAARFNEEVSRLQAQIAELEQFKVDIRRIVGLDTPAPVASPAVAPAAAPATPPQANPPVAQAAPQQASAPAASTSAAPASAPAANPPAAQPAAAPPTTAAVTQPVDERAATSLSSRGADGRSPSANDVLNKTADLIQNTVPQQKAELEVLRQEVDARVAKVASDWSSPEQLKQELSLYDASPRAWPVSGAIQARFGYDARRLEIGAQPFHEGIDIGGPVGTAVRSPQDGVVTFAGWNGTYGVTIEIRHSMGWSTLYAHLANNATVKVGQAVKKGQVIGSIGMTGLTTGAHLHYEIHLNGTPLDPAKYLGK